jgi:group I intron endonuclease
MKYAVIYKITSPNDNVYIGQSVNFSRRLKDYENMRCVNQRILYNSFFKYGFKNHKIEIIHKINKEIFNNSDLKNYLNKLESHYILEFKSFINMNPKGLNLTNGGDSNLLSDETKIKIGQSNKGKKRTEEQRKRSSEQRKGKRIPKEQILKIIKSRIGYKHTEETKHKLSVCKIKEKNHNFGKKFSEETRNKMSQSKIGKKRINVKKRSK